MTALDRDLTKSELRGALREAEARAAELESRIENALALVEVVKESGSASAIYTAELMARGLRGEA